jgi:hypothetical protein
VTPPSPFRLSIGGGSPTLNISEPSLPAPISDPVDEHLDKALASLKDLTVRELEATSGALELRKDGLGKFASTFPQVAHAREGGWGRIFPTSPVGSVSPAPTRSSPRRSRMLRRPSGRMCRMRRPSGIRNPAPLPRACRRMRSVQTGVTCGPRNAPRHDSSSSIWPLGGSQRARIRRDAGSNAIRAAEGDWLRRRFRRSASQRGSDFGLGAHKSAGGRTTPVGLGETTGRPRSPTSDPLDRRQRTSAVRSSSRRILARGAPQPGWGFRPAAQSN